MEGYSHLTSLFSLCSCLILCISEGMSLSLRASSSFRSSMYATTCTHSQVYKLDTCTIYELMLRELLSDWRLAIYGEWNKFNVECCEAHHHYSRCYVVALWTSSQYEEYYLTQNVWSSVCYLQIPHPHPLHIICETQSKILLSHTVSEWVSRWWSWAVHTTKSHTQIPFFWNRVRATHCLTSASCFAVSSSITDWWLVCERKFATGYPYIVYQWLA